MNIQAPPNLTPDAHGMYLLAGINDWGGISPVTKDHINPERPWPNLVELKAMRADAGFELRERFGLYPEYVREDAGSKASCRTRSAARDRDALADGDGLVSDARSECDWSKRHERRRMTNTTAPRRRSRRRDVRGCRSSRRASRGGSSTARWTAQESASTRPTRCSTYSGRALTALMLRRPTNCGGGRSATS